MNKTAREIAANNALRFYNASRVRLNQVDSPAELRGDILCDLYPKGAVLLDSGVEQPNSFEKYLIVVRPTILRRSARFLAVRNLADTNRVAAPALGAVATGMTISLETELSVAIVHNGPVDDPTSPALGGCLESREIEDVWVTGQWALTTRRKLRTTRAHCPRGRRGRRCFTDYRRRSHCLGMNEL